MKNTADLKIINAIDTVFSHASVDTCILIFKKGKPTKVELGELKDGNLTAMKSYQPEDFFENDFIINIAKSKSGADNKILNKFKNCIPLGDVAEVRSGLVAYEVGKGNPAQTEVMKNNRVYHSKNKADSFWVEYLDGVDVARYQLNWSGQFIKYGKNLAAPRKKEIFEGERILVRQIPSKPPYCINAIYTEEELINDRNSNNIINPTKDYNLKYILGVINSRLLSYWFIHTFDKFQRKIFPQFKVNELAKFPIYKADKKQQAGIIKLADKMLDLNKRLQAIPEHSSKWDSVKKEIEKTDREIDERVFDLYGLTEEEREVIEKN